MVNQNIYRQIHYLKDITELTQKHVPAIKLRADIIRALNYHAVINLTDKPGEYRTEPVSITGSNHQPPEHDKISGHVIQLIRNVNDWWDEAAATELAAYVLWRICWIHPFEEGNGRTARALSYYIICRKYERWLPGRKILPLALKEDHEQAYYTTLSTSDSFNEDSLRACRNLALLIELALITQLKSVK